MKHKKNFIGIFLIIIYGSLITIGINFLSYKLLNKTIDTTDNWKYFTPKKENNVIDKIDNLIEKEKTLLENITTNYFPFYTRIMHLYSTSTYNINKLFYTDVPIKENNENEKLFYDKNCDCYHLVSIISSSELEKKFYEQVNFFNNLDLKDIYIYMPVNYNLLKDVNYSDSYYLDLFPTLLNDNIHYKHIDVENISDYIKYMYKTDHHWNSDGALKAYYDIMELLGKKSIPNLETYTVNDKYIYGSLGKQAFLSLTHDTLKDINIKLDYNVNINDASFKPREMNLNKTYQYTDYYVQYFDGQRDEIIYEYPQNKDENLLIICDSFAWPIDYLIASSFSKTYVVNLRYGKFLNNDFDLHSYIETNDIDKVLFLYSGNTILFDNYNYDLKGRIK